MKYNLQNKNNELKHIINKISTIILMITVLNIAYYSGVVNTLLPNKDKIDKLQQTTKKSPASAGLS